MKYNTCYGCSEAFLRTDHCAVYCPEVFEVDDPDWETNNKQVVIEFIDRYAAEAVFDLMAEDGMRGQEDDECKFYFTAPDDWGNVYMKIVDANGENKKTYQINMVTFWEPAYCKVPQSKLPEWAEPLDADW